MSVDHWTAFEYEVQMFHETRARLAIPDRETTVRNALVESSLLHTRVLIDALLDRGQEPDNVNLKTLLNGLPKLPKLGKLATVLRTAYGNRNQVNAPCWTLNKRLAHLTSVRGDSFNYAPLYAVLDPLVRAMLHEVAVVTRRPVLCRYAGVSPQGA